MSSQNLTIKALDGTAVVCQTHGCEKPALFMFSATGGAPPFTAYCEAHARQYADRERLSLPAAKESGSRRWSQASA